MTEWNSNAQTAIIGTANQGPTVAYLHLAMVQGAVYDAVNAIEGGYEPYLGAPAMADQGDSAPAAVATAAHDVLVALFPGQQVTLDAKLATSLARSPTELPRPVGSRSARRPPRRCSPPGTNDGRFSPFTVTQGDEPGEWRSTAFLNGNPVVEPAPWVGNVKPFLIPSAAALRSDGPNPLTSAAYAADFNEVKRLGSLTSTVRTPDQTDAALFWQANGAALFNAIFRQLAGNPGAGYRRGGPDVRDDEHGRCGRRDRLLERQVLLELLAADHGDPPGRQRWEPGDRGRPDLDAAVRHAAVPRAPVGTHVHQRGRGGDAPGVLRHGQDRVRYVQRLLRPSRSFERFSEAIKEIIDARVWAGIHFRTADVQGAVLGKKVARYLREHYFQPVG